MNFNMKKLFLFLAFAGLAGAAQYDVKYIQESATGSKVERTATLTPSRFQWVGATGQYEIVTADSFLTNLGGTTVGKSLFMLTNPGAITFLRINADNSVTARSGVNFLADIGAVPLTGGTLTGHLLFTDNTYDIGASGATRPRTGYFGTSVVSPLFVGNLTGNVNGLTLAGTNGSTLNIGTGGTLGTAAYTAATAYEVPLTFSTGLTRTTNTITVNAAQPGITSLGGLTTALTVPEGGTGRVTGTTAYGLIAAGTTATGAQQTLAAGATTEILVGGGAGALPVWTTANGTGAPVRETNASLTTPNIGVATGSVASIRTATEATDTSCNLVFVTASGTQTLPPVTNTSLTFNSSTAALGASIFAVGNGGVSAPSMVFPNGQGIYVRDTAKKTISFTNGSSLIFEVNTVDSVFNVDQCKLSLNAVSTGVQMYRGTDTDTGPQFLAENDYGLTAGGTQRAGVDTSGFYVGPTGAKTATISNAGAIATAGKITATLTTAQARFAYDGSNYWEPFTASNGAVTFDATGAGAGFTFSDLVIPSAGIRGTATNDNATTGNIGEIVTSTVSSGSAVSMAVSGTAYDVTSISLTAGDWDVSGNVVYNLTGATVTLWTGSFNSTSATHAAAQFLQRSSDATTALTQTAAKGMAVATRRVSVSATTTIYLVASANYSVGSVDAYGFIQARRSAHAK